MEWLAGELQNDWRTLGVGMGEGQHDGGAQSMTIFAPVVWPQAEQARAQVVPADLHRPLNLHVTLGFTLCDVHSVPKDGRSLMSDREYASFSALAASINEASNAGCCAGNRCSVGSLAGVSRGSADGVPPISHAYNMLLENLVAAGLTANLGEVG